MCESSSPEDGYICWDWKLKDPNTLNTNLGQKKNVYFQKIREKT